MWSVEKQRHSTGECLRQRNTKVSKEAYQIIQSMARLEDNIPQHLSLEIFKLDFKVSSPLSQKLKEIQLETNLHLAMKQQASEMQNLDVSNKYQRKKGLSP